MDVAVAVTRSGISCGHPMAQGTVREGVWSKARLSLDPLDANEPQPFAVKYVWTGVCW
jgi:hypothetical protein